MHDLNEKYCILLMFYFLERERFDFLVLFLFLFFLEFFRRPPIRPLRLSDVCLNDFLHASFSALNLGSSALRCSNSLFCELNISKAFDFLGVEDIDCEEDYLGCGEGCC